MYRILIVEDSKSMRELIYELLISELPFDANIEVVEDGQQACNLLSDFLPDLVITDLNMPVMSGHELIDFIRREHTTSIIAISSADGQAGEGGMTALDLAKQVGADFTIPKNKLIYELPSLVESIFL